MFERVNAMPKRETKQVEAKRIFTYAYRIMCQQGWAEVTGKRLEDHFRITYTEIYRHFASLTNLKKSLLKKAASEYRAALLKTGPKISEAQIEKTFLEFIHRRPGLIRMLIIGDQPGHLLAADLDDVLWRLAQDGQKVPPRKQTKFSWTVLATTHFWWENEIDDHEDGLLFHHLHVFFSNLSRFEELPFFMG